MAYYYQTVYLAYQYECAAARLNTCSLSWSVVPTRVRIRARVRN